MKTNPFTLSFGMEPSQQISRITQAGEITGTFTSDSPSTYAYMITGVRGSGKTVMLTNLSEQFEKEYDWIVVNVTPESDILNSIAAKLYSRKELKNIFVKAKLDFSAFGLGVSLERGEQIFDMETALEKMLEELKKKNKRVLIAIDEIISNEHVRIFASAFQLLLRRKLPIFLIMTGLYENIYNLQNEKTLTFLYRTPKIMLDPLSIGAISRSYESIFDMDKDAALNMAKLTKGYAFAYQALGYLYWNERSKIGHNPNIENILPKYDETLETYVYEKIWSELSPKEKEIVAYLANDEKVKVAEIREKTGDTNNSFSVYRDRLKKKGIIDTSLYGHISLKLPRFGEIIQAWI